MSTLAPTFDYAALDKTDRVVVEQKTAEIRDRMGRAAQNIVEIGERLLVVKGALDHGQFGTWLESEFGWGHSTASKMMQVASKFPQSGNLNIAPSALYLLASPSTPDDIRDQFIDAAKSGKPVTHAEVKAAVAPRMTQAEIDAQREALDAVDPLLVKHREAQERKTPRRESDDEPTITNDFSAPERKPVPVQVQPKRHVPSGGEVWAKWIAECARVLNDTRDAGGIEKLVTSWAPGEDAEYLDALRDFRDAAHGWIAYLEKRCRNNRKAG